MKKRNLLIATGIIVGTLYLSDKMNLPTKVLENYSNLKYRMKSAIGADQESKTKKAYESAYDIMLNLPDSLRVEMIDDIISKYADPIRIYDSLPLGKKDSLNDHIIKALTPEGRVEHFVETFKEMDRGQRWLAVKEITRYSFR